MLNTERLCIYSATREQMETMIASEQDAELKKAYSKLSAVVEIERENIRIQTIRSEQIFGENVYQLLPAFDELYDEMDEPGKKELLRAIIERIDLFPEKREDGC